MLCYKNRSLTKNLSVITKEQSLKIKKSQTEHKRYGELLYEIGKSREPLSSTQIEKGYAKAKTNPLKSAKYVHEMLKELCPTEYVIGDFLFIWEDLIENEESDEYKRGEY